MDTIRDTLLVSGTGKTATSGSLAVLALAIVLVFTVLLFEFGNFAVPIAVLSSALLSTCGVFVALLVTGVTFNISSFMGLIMVIGIVAKNGLLNAGRRPRERSKGRCCRTASTSWWSGSRRQTVA
jgi:multidrug efflux pump subunit AcrB